MATKRIRLTRLEASAIWNAAGNMRDDFADFYGSIMPKNTAKKFEAAYKSGMDKLYDIANRNGLMSRELTPLEEQEHDALNNN